MVISPQTEKLLTDAGPWTLSLPNCGKPNPFPPELNPEDAGRLRKEIQSFYLKSPAVFHALFLNENVIESLPIDSTLLAEAGLVREVGDGYKATIRLFPHRGRFFATDFISIRQADRVFPCDEDGSGFLADHLNIQYGDVVLDLGTGCGILATFCAEKAKRVVATDVNPKALAYADFNIRLNGVADKVELLEGDLFGPIAGREFDVIVSNPPPVPVPAGTPFYTHSNGGPDGMAVFERILKEIWSFTSGAPRFRSVMMSMLRSEDPIIVDRLRFHFKHANIKTTLTPIYPSRVEVDPMFTSLFSSVPSFPEWHTFIRNQGIVWLDCFFIDVEPHSEFEIQVNPYADGPTVPDWQKRFAKFVLPS